MHVFGSRLREARERRGISQALLAKEINVNEKRVSNWEIAKHEPPLEVIDRLCDVLKTHPNYLMGHSDEPQKGNEASADVLDEIRDQLNRIENIVTGLSTAAK